MSWRDRFNGQGDLDGVLFYVLSDELTFGRKTVKHEYPLRDEPFIEDIGGVGWEFTIEVFVIGEDYDIDRDAMIAVFDKPGPYNLNHPYLGKMRVSQSEGSQPKKTETTAEGGMARFTLSLVRQSERTPLTTIVPATAEAVAAAVIAAETAAESDFIEKYSTEGLPEEYVDDLLTQVKKALGTLETIIGDKTTELTNAINSPVELSGVIIDSISTVKNSLEDPFEAMATLQKLFFEGPDLTNELVDTPTRKTKVQSSQSLNQIVRRFGLTQAALVSSTTTYKTKDDALTQSKNVLDGIEAQLLELNVVTGEPVPDSIYFSLHDLSTAQSADLSIRGALLPEITTITLLASQPALVLAYSRDGNLDNYQDSVDRNKIKRPLFLPANVPIEVLQ